MNRLKEFIIISIALCLPAVATHAILFFMDKALRTRNKFMCIESYMYMRVENTLLAYPNSLEPMRCEVFEYNLKNREIKNVQN